MVPELKLSDLESLAEQERTPYANSLGAITSFPAEFSFAFHLTLAQGTKHRTILLLIIVEEKTEALSRRNMGLVDQRNDP